jgi:hypothetical protein
VRQLGSKLFSGGLSAGVVLLWWPLFFPTDTVTSWLGRGVVWTLSFELLLLALTPFELALWTTEPGERLTRKVHAARVILEHPSPRRRIGRRAAVALTALAVPLALIAAGLHSHVPIHHQSTRVTQVTKVVRVVRPLEVRRVVKVRTISRPIPVPATHVATRAPAPVSPKRKSPATKPKHEGKATPIAHTVTPVSQTPPTQSGTTGPAASDVQTSAG